MTSSGAERFGSRRRLRGGMVSVRARRCLPDVDGGKSPGTNRPEARGPGRFPGRLTVRIWQMGENGCLPDVGIEPGPELAEVNLIDRAVVVRVEECQIGLVTSSGVEGAAELPEIDLVHDAVAVGVTKQPEEAKLSSPATSGVGGAGVSATGDAVAGCVYVVRVLTPHPRSVDGQSILAVPQGSVVGVANLGAQRIDFRADKGDVVNRMSLARKRHSPDKTHDRPVGDPLHLERRRQALTAKDAYGGGKCHRYTSHFRALRRAVAYLYGLDRRQCWYQSIFEAIEAKAELPERLAGNAMLLERRPVGRTPL